ncbi:MAG: winged helix-turn-helix transcriptional regulator [Candidatus Sulfotelmatobacter sp.]
MPLKQVNLRERLDRARRRFDLQLGRVLQRHPELSYAQIRKRFGISENVIRRIIKQFQLGRRKRGPKPRRSLGTRS